MLYRDPTTLVNELSGRAIARSDLSKSQLAAYAAMVALDERQLDDLTREQICKALGVSLAYLNKAIALSTETRNAVAAGQLTLQDIPVNPTDRVLHKVTHDAGVARVWGMLEPMI